MFANIVSSFRRHGFNSTRATIIAAVSITIGVTNSQVLYALDYQFYSGNDIIYYDPDAGICNSTESQASNVEIVANENAEFLIKYFAEQGFSVAAAAGIIGNLTMESTLNPAKIEGGAIAPDNYIPQDGTGFGLAQWTYNERQIPLEASQSKGKKITDISMQADFIMKELKESYPQVIKALDPIKDDPVKAAIVFHGITPNIQREGASINPVFAAANPPLPGFEGSGDTSSTVVNNRGGAAESYYNTYKK